jgi:hypothetical protein
MATAKRGSVNLALQDIIAAFQIEISKVDATARNLETETAALDSLSGLCQTLAQGEEARSDLIRARALYSLMNSVRNHSDRLSGAVAQLEKWHHGAAELLATVPEWAGKRFTSYDPTTGKRRTWRPIGPAVEWVKPSDLIPVKLGGGINPAALSLTKAGKAATAKPKRSRKAKPAKCAGKAVRS